MNMEPESLHNVFDSAFAGICQVREAFTLQLMPKEVGTISSVANGIAEHFMKAGREVLIVNDDLTHPARAYRELSLLLRRPPGRDAFTGDILYIHSRLLERATHLSQELTFRGALAMALTAGVGTLFGRIF